MKFAVNPYKDQIKQKPDTKPEFVAGRFSRIRQWQFDTKAEARQFIIYRAEQAVAAADKVLRRAEARRERCLMKFGVTAEERAATARQTGGRKCLTGNGEMNPRRS